MKKKTFALLVLGCVGGLLFSLGLCMCLLPEWNAFTPGCVSTGIGIVLLLILFFLTRLGKTRAPVNWPLVGRIAYGALSALVLGTGMALVMEFGQMLWGIGLGILGLVLLLGLIPMCLGFKD